MKIHMLFLTIICGIASGNINAKMVRVTDEANYKQILATSNKPTLVEFAAEWCSVCTGIQKPLEEVSSDPEFSHVSFVQVDVDKCDGLCKERGIVGVPTFVYIHEGKEKIKETGVQKIEDFPTHIRTNLRQHFSVAQNTTASNIMAEAPTIQEEQVTITETEQMTPEQGMFARIVSMLGTLLTSLLMMLKNTVMAIIESIKGFFNK